MKKQDTLKKITPDGWSWEAGKQLQSCLKKKKQDFAKELSAALYIYKAISSWMIYHFHDTGKHAGMRHSKSIDDNSYLRFDAENIAPYLF